MNQSPQQATTHLPELPPLLRYSTAVILGGGAGIIAAVIAGVSSFYMELMYFVPVLLAPLFALTGAACAIVSVRHGFSKISPLVGALVGAFFLNVQSPIGWVIGGVVGGIITARLSEHRTVRKTVLTILLGAAVGLVGWALVLGYLVGIFVTLG